MRRIVQALVAIVISAGAMEANATASVDVRALWSLRLSSASDPIPGGIDVSCFGGATSFDIGCQDQRQLFTSLSGNASGHFSATSLSGLRLTNTTDHDIGGQLTFLVEFSAFNPGGPDIGVQVTDPVLEFASFSSSVTGPGAGDSHSCATDPQQPACGVGSPDTSLTQFDVTLPGAGLFTDLTYVIDVEADLRSVPEPSTLAGLLSAVLIAAGAKSRPHRREH